MYAQLCHRISKEGSTLEAENDFFENLLIRVCRDKFINRSQYSERIINSPLATEIDEEERRYVAKQKILGNVKFIGELFKLGMLNAAIIHNMLEQLLDKKSRSYPTLEDRCEDMECFSQIFKTCGKQLDTDKSKNLIDQYFDIMDQKSNSYKYPPRIRFLLRDVIELRRDGWTPRKIARVEGPVPIQDLSSDEDYLRQQREVRSRAMEYQNRNNDRNWMDKLPLSLQSMNNYGPLSMTSSSSINVNVNMSNYNNHQGRGGDMGNERGGGGGGGYRNHRNQDINQRSMGKYNNQNDGKMNPNKKHYRQHDNSGFSNQNHHHGQNNHNSYNNNNNNNSMNGNMNSLNKELAPRFKRNIMTPATPNSVDDLQMRPSPNSLLFKASSMKSNQQQMPMNSMNRSATGSPSIDNLIPSFNNMNPATNGRNTSSPQLPQPNVQNAQGVPPTSHFMTAAAQSKNAVNHHQNSKSSPTPSSPQNVQGSPKESAVQAQHQQQQNNSQTQQQPVLVTKQGSVEKPKPKKDKGPNKDEYMKKVTQFTSESLLEKKFLDNYHSKQTNVKVEKTQLIEEMVDSENNNGHAINGETEIIEECLNGDTNDESAIPTLDDIVKSFYELKVPEKFLKDSIVKVINESLDKGEQAHDIVVDFLQILQNDKRLSQVQQTDALRAVINGMSEREKTIPKVTTMVASLLARGISKNITKITEIANFTENGQNYPLLLLIFQQLHKVIGEDELVDLFNNSKINLMSSLPECDRTKDRLAEILDDRKLSFLQPLLRIESELWKQIQTDSQPQTFYKWIKDNVPASRHTDPGFITALMTVLLKFISQESTFVEGSDSTKLPEKQQIETERKLLNSFSRILNAFLNGQLELQLITIYTLQVYCFQHQFPKGMLLRWFTALYELEICEEDAFLKWKEDITDAYPGKGKALFQVNTWLTWLQEASEEEDED